MDIEGQNNQANINFFQILERKLPTFHSSAENKQKLLLFRKKAIAAPSIGKKGTQPLLKHMKAQKPFKKDTVEMM